VDRRAQEEAMIEMVLRGPQMPDLSGTGGSAATSLFSADMLRVLSEARHGRGRDG